MFAARYYPGRFYPRRYFPAVGQDLISIIRTVALTGYVRSQIAMEGVTRATTALTGYVRQTFNLEGFLK